MSNRNLDESNNAEYDNSYNDNYNYNHINTNTNDILHIDYRNSGHYEESQLASRLLLINDLCSISNRKL